MNIGQKGKKRRRRSLTRSHIPESATSVTNEIISRQNGRPRSTVIHGKRRLSRQMMIGPPRSMIDGVLIGHHFGKTVALPSLLKNADHRHFAATGRAEVPVRNRWSSQKQLAFALHCWTSNSPQEFIFPSLRFARRPHCLQTTRHARYARYARYASAFWICSELT